MVERESIHKLEKDLGVEKDLLVVQGDLKLFRQCFSERGGSCQGSSSTALPHSSTAASGEDTHPVTPGTSKTLSESVASLPNGHPAKSAHAVLSHSVTKSAAALHNHLRGHDSGTTQGSTHVEKSDGLDGAESIVHLKLGLRHLATFSDLLFGSIGSRGFERLNEHCQSLLAEASKDDSAELAALRNECRSAAFVNRYFDAYFRNGQLVGADVDLSGVEADVSQWASKVDDKIQALESATQGKVDDLATQLTSKLSAELDQKAAEIDAALKKQDASASPVASHIASELKEQIQTTVQQEATTLKSNLNDFETTLLGPVETDVDGLAPDVTKLQTQANQKLGNVFKVSSVGFVSRDLTYQAKVPSFEITFDPTASHLITVEDSETQQQVDQHTDFSHLGVMNNQSGADLGGQMVRIFLEALFDAHEGLPALGLPVQATGLNVGDYSLPVFNAPMGHVSLDDWQTMGKWNSQVSTNVEAVMSRLAGGFGAFSINNPALEELIVEIVTVSVRKAAEKATWCWFACNLDVAVSNTEQAFKTGIDGELKQAEEAIDGRADSLKDRVEGEAKKLAEGVADEADKVGDRIADDVKAEAKKVAGYLHHEAEQVRLRLKIHR